ncbi:MAG: magnesium chelatase, partial [Candidatus Sericytochromatia bacterium]
DLLYNRPTESSEKIRERVVRAREIQQKRFEEAHIFSNSQMQPKHIKKYCKLDDVSIDLLKRAINQLSLSARAHDRILKVARTIADLDSSENIKPQHIAEAIQYRSLDRARF